MVRSARIQHGIPWESQHESKAKGECYVDVSFHLVVADPSSYVLGQELPALVKDGYTSIKVFMTYENQRLRDDEILATLDSARTSAVCARGNTLDNRTDGASIAGLASSRQCCPPPHMKRKEWSTPRLFAAAGLRQLSLTA